MPKEKTKVEVAAKGDPNDEPIAIPAAGASSGPAASDQQLLDMQEEMFGADGKKEKEKPPVVRTVKKPDRAQQLINGAEKATKEIEKVKKAAPPKEEPEADDAEQDELPSFLDLDSKDDAEEESEDEGEEEEEEEDVAEDDDEEDAPPAVDVSKETNIKKLRTIVGDKNRELREAQAEVKRLNGELKKGPETSALENQVVQLRDKVKKLEVFETVFALHQNEGFRQKHIEGDKALQVEMEDIAKDYAVEPSVIADLMSLSNRKDVDELLSENFSSDSARQDLKVLKQKRDALLRERREAEKEPAKALERLESGRIQTEAERNQKRDQIFKSALEDGWSLAISQAASLPREQKIYELIEIPGKKQHNEGVVRPTLNNARAMVESGLKHIEKMVRNRAPLDEGFSRWFAMVCQQAAAAQMVNRSRNEIGQQLEETQKTSTKQNGYARPGINPPSRSTSSKKKAKPKTAHDIAAAIFTEVTGEGV